MIKPNGSNKQIVFWPGFNEPYHPLWPEEILRLWVDKKMGTKEQLERYQADLGWYEAERKRGKNADCSAGSEQQSAGCGAESAIPILRQNVAGGEGDIS